MSLNSISIQSNSRGLFSRYQYICDLDRAMMQLDEKHKFITQGPGYVNRKHDRHKLVTFEKEGFFGYSISIPYRGADYVHCQIGNV